MRPIEQYHRQLDLTPMEALQKTHFTIIGAGSLGSFTTTLLAHMGAERITLFDDDTVEEHNLPVQFLNKAHLGKPKVVALQDQLKDWYNMDINVCVKKFTTGDPVSTYVISGVDSMKVRQDLWKEIKYQPQVKRYIDTRAGGLTAAIYVVDPNDLDDIEIYEKTLSSEGVAPLPCTERMTTHVACQVGSLVSNLIVKLLQKKTVPKSLIYDAENLVYFGTEAFFLGKAE